VYNHKLFEDLDDLGIRWREYNEIAGTIVCGDDATGPYGRAKIADVQAALSAAAEADAKFDTEYLPDDTHPANIELERYAYKFDAFHQAMSLSWLPE
jgi:hypothetical protein